MNSYETMFIVDVSNGEEATEATVNKFMSVIEANAEVVDVAKWGKRRLAYLINDMPEGYYTVVTYKCAPEFPAELDRLFNIDENVMRAKTFKLEYDAAEKKAAKVATEAVAEAATEEAATEETAPADAE
ncbi:MAG: 30S ribosomal protein S6 [Ruminococcaceae bacterium]|nr:30S ribosomal protein S6 [Oscillospiraceae bacterium]